MQGVWRQVRRLGAVFQVPSSRHRQSSAPLRREVAMRAAPGRQLPGDRRALPAAGQLLPGRRPLRRVPPVRLSADAGRQLHAERAADRLGGARMAAEPGGPPPRPHDPDGVDPVERRRRAGGASGVRGAPPCGHSEAADAALRALQTAAAALQAVSVQPETGRCRPHDVCRTWPRETC